MTAFDLRTLLLLVSMVSGLQAIALAFFLLIGAARYPGIGVWVLGSAINATGFVLIFLRDLLPDMLSIVIGNTALVVAAGLVLHGINRFQGRAHPLQSLMALLLALLTLLGNAWFTYPVPSMPWRIAVNSAVLGLLYAQCAYNLFREGLPQVRSATWVSGSFFGLAGVGLLIRTLLVASGASFERFVVAQSLGLLSFIAAAPLVLLWGTTVVAMIGQRLFDDMRLAQAAERFALERAAREAIERADVSRALLEANKEAQAQLQQREALLRSLSDNMPDGLLFQLVRDPDGKRRFSYLTARVEQLWCVPHADALADAELLYERIHPDDRPGFEAAGELAYRTMGRFEQEARVCLPDGRMRWALFRSLPLVMPDGSVCRNGVELDVTARKQAEHALRRRLDELLMLNQIAQRLTSWIDLSSGAASLGEALRDLFEAQTVAIWIYEDQPPALRRLVLVEAEGVRSDGSQLAPLDHPVAARLLTRQVPQLLDQSASATTYFWGLPPGFQTIAMPLRSRNAPVGLLLVSAARREQQYGPADITLAQTVGGLLANAMANARLFAQARSEAAVQERRRLARELHDSVSQALYAASRTAEVLPTIWELDPAEGREMLEELHRFTVSAQAEMRSLLVELRPHALVEAPLHETLSHFGPTLSAKHQLQIDMDLKPVPLLPPDVQVALYRIVQEALNNVGKHAQASRVLLRLRVEPVPGTPWQGSICIIVADDGRGFDPSLEPRGRMGLSSMRERAEEIGAGLDLFSAPGKGTRLMLTWRGAALARDNSERQHEHAEAYSRGGR